jgi:Flp pilus assembly protein TadD
VLELDPDSAPTLANLGAALLQKGKVEEAISFAGRAAKIQPGDFNSHNILGSALRQAGRLEEACQAFEAALKIDPGSGAAHFNLAQTLRLRRMIPEALRHYEKAMQSLPGNPTVVSNYTWVLAASPDPKIRNGKLAVELAQEASRAVGYRNLDLLRSLAAAFAANGQFEEARQTADRLITLAQENGREDAAAVLGQDREAYAQSKWLEDQTLMPVVAKP